MKIRLYFFYTTISQRQNEKYFHVKEVKPHLLIYNNARLCRSSWYCCHASHAGRKLQFDHLTASRRRLVLTAQPIFDIPNPSMLLCWSSRNFVRPNELLWNKRPNQLGASGKKKICCKHVEMNESTEILANVSYTPMEGSELSSRLIKWAEETGPAFPTQCIFIIRTYKNADDFRRLERMREKE